LEGLFAQFQLQLLQDFGLTLTTEVDAPKNANDNGRPANLDDGDKDCGLR
jgi:hypothetical protein